VFSGLERVSEKRRGKKEKIASDETQSSPVLENASESITSDENQTENVLSDLKEMVSDISKSLVEEKSPVSDTQKEIPVIRPSHQTTQAPVATPKTTGIDSRVKAILPPWMEKAWRWVSPDDPELLEEWLKEWGDLVLSYSEALGLHIVKPREMLVTPPFKNPLVKRQLSIEQIHSVGDDLERRQLAKWWDSRKNRLRVYWLPLDEISDLIHEWALDGGRDVVTVFDLRNASEEWSSVPPKELRQLMEILVKNKRANWADKAQEAIEFVY
jgi:hypothetical protein